MSMAQPVSGGGGSESEGVEVTCHRCEYTWIYTGERWTATCPNCNAKTKTGLGPGDDEDE